MAFPISPYFCPSVSIQYCFMECYEIAKILIRQIACSNPRCFRMLTVYICRIRLAAGESVTRGCNLSPHEAQPKHGQASIQLPHQYKSYRIMELQPC